MIVAWPLLLVVVVILVRRGHRTAGGRGWKWSSAWIGAGFLWSFSLVTGLSIGLLLLPAAAVVMLWVARRSPHLAESLGFFAGLAVTVVFVAALHA
jgi:hypothetical protein